MSTPKSRIYYILTSLITFGYLWVIINLIVGSDYNQSVCPIKVVTGYPCPSCGSTRAVILLIRGDFLNSIGTNPFGVLIFLVLLLGPVWLLYDYLSKKDTFWVFYKKIETTIDHKTIAIPLIILVVANWIWNIIKEL